MGVASAGAGWPHVEARGGRCRDLRFESAYVPLNARLRDRYLAHEANRFARARYWSHGGRARSTIIAVHGFAGDPYWLNQWLFALPWFYSIGCDVLLVTLPFHGARRTRGSVVSGPGFFSGGTSWIHEAFGQAATQAPQPMQAAASKARSALRFSTGTACASGCLLYPSDAADERSSVALGGPRIIKKKNTRLHDPSCG